MAEMMNKGPIWVSTGDIAHAFHDVLLFTEITRCLCLAINHKGTPHYFQWQTLPMGHSFSPVCLQSIMWTALTHYEFSDNYPECNDSKRCSHCEEPYYHTEGLCVRSVRRSGEILPVLLFGVHGVLHHVVSVLFPLIGDIPGIVYVVGERALISKTSDFSEALPSLLLIYNRQQERIGFLAIYLDNWWLACSDAQIARELHHRFLRNLENFHLPAKEGSVRFVKPEHFASAKDRPDFPRRSI